MIGLGVGMRPSSSKGDSQEVYGELLGKVSSLMEKGPTGRVTGSEPEGAMSNKAEPIRRAHRL